MPDVAGRVADAFAARMREEEERALSPLAVRSYETRGRDRPEDECTVRTPFQRDRDRLVHSKPFRRLKGKTQVFIDPAGDHYRTRMTHTLETAAIARVVARALRLNEDLVEAVGLGHDTGHTPFGHAGEEGLDEQLRTHFGGDGVRHNEQSLRIAEELNLTYEVRDGILTHTGPREPEPHAGPLVRRGPRRMAGVAVTAMAGLPDRPGLAAVGETGSHTRGSGGGALAGGCPFREERTGSFWVDPGKLLSYCCGCGAKGALSWLV